MYSFNSRIRYSEVDSSKKLDLSSIINYFQDCSTFQSEDIGLGIDYLEEHKKLWLLNSWQIIVTRFPTLCENITVGTWAYAFKGAYGYRNFIMKDINDNTIAIANSVWFLLNTENNSLCKITSDDIKGYEQCEKYPMDYAPRKIPLPKEFITHNGFLVVSSNIDTNNHVNNGQYVKMAEDYLPANFCISQMRAQYCKSALLGDMIFPKVNLTTNSCTIVLAGIDDSPYAIVEFTKL